MKLKQTLQKLSSIRRSSRGKNALIFLGFLCVSTCLWFVMTINDEFQREIEIPVILNEMPDSVTLLSPTPRVISASVKSKGNTLLRYEWGEISPIKLRYADFSNVDGRLVMGENQIISVLRNYFGGNTQIISAKPDSIAIRFTTRPGKKVGVKLAIQASADPRYVISGSIKMSTDSVMLYSASDIPASLTYLTTSEDILAGLTDTTSTVVRIKAPAGMRAIPDHIDVTVPVEPLIAKTREVPIEAINLPHGINLVTFPSQVQVTYLLPMSLYNKESHILKVYVDFNKISPSPEDTKVPLEPLELPTTYQGVTVALDSVEYVIEHK